MLSRYSQAPLKCLRWDAKETAEDTTCFHFHMKHFLFCVNGSNSNPSFWFLSFIAIFLLVRLKLFVKDFHLKGLIWCAFLFYIHSFYVVNSSKFNLIIASRVKGHSWVPLGLFISKMEERGCAETGPLVVVLECRDFLRLNWRVWGFHNFDPWFFSIRDYFVFNIFVHT